MRKVKIYVDGSFYQDKPSWAFLVLDGDTLIYKNRGVLDKYAENRQIGGECEAVIQALKYCKENNLKAEIFYDYIGIYEWVKDLFGGKPWKTNKEVSVNYRKICLEYKDCIDNFVKVKAHSGNIYNEMVDKYTRAELVDNTVVNNKPFSGKKYVLGFCFDENLNHLVLILKNNKIKSLENKWNGLGGAINENETSENAIIREFKEECGLEVNNWTKFAELKAEDGGFIEIFSSKISYYRLTNAYTKEKEKVMVFKIKDDLGGLIFQPDFANNLPWLISMAINNETKAQKYIFKVEEIKL